MSTKKWLIGELQSLFGFQEVDEMASALLDNFPHNDPEGLRTNYLEELLGKNSSTQKLSQELATRLAVESDSSVRVGAKKKKKTNSNTPNSVKAVSSLSAAAEQQPPSVQTLSQQNKFPDRKLSQKEKARLNKLHQNTRTGGIKISYEGKQRKSAPIQEGMFEIPEASGGNDRLDFELNTPPIQLTHSATPTGAGLIVNCLSCGYVNVVAAKGEKSKIWGECTFCGAFLDRGSEITTAPGFASALALKNRLVQYDLESTERHAVYDDEADYYTSAAWLNELEQEELKKRDKARHEKMHSRRRDMVVTIDLAGRRVVEEVDEDGLDAARDRYITNKNSTQRHLDNMTDMSSSETSEVQTGASGGGGGGGVFGYDSSESAGGMFKNDTLTGRSRDVVESLTSLFDSLKNGQTKSNSVSDGLPSKGSDGMTTEKKSKGKSSRNTPSVPTASVTELEEHLAPWRKSSEHKQRVNFSYE